MKWLNRWLVKSPIYYCLVLDEREFTKKLNYLKIPNSDRPQYISPGSHATIHFFENADDSDECAIICLSDTVEHSLTEVIGLLTHEAMHLWRAIRTNLGESKPSSEFEAYAMQGLIQSIISALLETEQGKALIKKELKKN